MGWSFRLFSALVACLVLTACGPASEPVWAPQADVTRAAYRHDGANSITLITVIDNERGTGAHAALLINASQRIIFDPAGTWYHPRLPERNDVHFGMTDNAVEFYIDYHARIQYRVVLQEVIVSPEVAEIAMQRAMAYGSVPSAQCTRAVTSILNGLPGFETVRSGWFPKRAAAGFAKIPGVTERVVYDNDPTNNTGFITAYGI